MIATCKRVSPQTKSGKRFRYWIFKSSIPKFFKNKFPKTSLCMCNYRVKFVFSMSFEYLISL